VGVFVENVERRRTQALGNAIVDLEVQVDDGFIERLGVTKGQMMLVDETLQEEVLAAVVGSGVHRSSGGSAANTAVGIADLGGQAGFCGKVARDDLGSFYVADLRTAGVRAEALPGDGRTGTCVVLVSPDAQRTMLTHLGAARDLGPDDVDRLELDDCAWLYVEGYLLTGERTSAAAHAAIERAVRAGVRVALTASDPFVIERCRDEMWALIEGPVDLLFCNEQEARSLTRRDDLVECAREVHRHAASVALTLGAEGSLLMDDGHLHPVGGVPATAVDTTGAGDMYAAGILHGLTSGLDWPTAGHLASHAAARVVSQFGARLPRRFTDEEMRALVERR
jgi:sugar/nucleoside kinase (ribokinase family)